MGIRYDIKKTERDKKVYDIILEVWKFIKPYTTTQYPLDDKQWDKVVEDAGLLHDRLKTNLSTPEIELAAGLIHECLEYCHRREAEARRTPD